MPTTNCTVCQKLYEEQSEEQANHPDRTCLDCFHEASNHPYRCRCMKCNKWWGQLPPESTCL